MRNTIRYHVLENYHLEQFAVCLIMVDLNEAFMPDPNASVVLASSHSVEPAKHTLILLLTIGGAAGFKIPAAPDSGESGDAGDRSQPLMNILEPRNGRTDGDGRRERGFD